MRIVVIGSSGAGKSTLARRIAARLGVPHIELDAINWQAGWRDLVLHDPPEFVRRVSEATRTDAWVADGNYRPVRDQVWRRATHLIWLDYDRPLIMARVIRRSLLRAVLRTELWAGNRERWRQLLRPSHPIRWAWSTWARHRREYEERLRREEYAGLVVLRLRRPAEAEAAIQFLAETAAVTPPCASPPEGVAPPPPAGTAAGPG
jgi:adenylate kinase family enzyme